MRSVGVGWRELAERDRGGARARRRKLRAGAGLRHHRLARLLSAEGHLRGAADASASAGSTCASPDPALLAGKLLYVDEVRPGGHPHLKQIFARVEQVAELPRKRGPLAIETYALDLLEGAKGDVLDRSPPPELQ